MDDPAANPANDVGAEEITRTPRWVKVLGIVLLVVAVAFIILMITRGPGGRGEHSPMRHFGGQSRP